MRALVVLVLIAVGGLLGTPIAACAKDLPPEIRAMAERAFVEGRIEDLETTLAGASSDADRYPLLLSTRWWRLAEGYEPADLTTADWAQHADAERWPLVGALRFDRTLRETVGARGLRQLDPLRDYRKGLDEERDADLIWYLEDLFRLRTETYDEQELFSLQERRRYERLWTSANLVAMGALGAFVVLTFFGALFVARYRREDESA